MAQSPVGLGMVYFLIVFIYVFGTSHADPLPLQNSSSRHGALRGIFNLQHDLIYPESQQIHPNHDKARSPREIHLLRLRDPLDCLSQVVCGLNTYPPQKPSVRTSTANDFAYLLKTAVGKLRLQKPPTTTTTTTPRPSTKRSPTKAPLDDEDGDDYDDDDYTGENDVEYVEEPNDFDNYSDGPHSGRYKNNLQKQRISTIFRREGRGKKSPKEKKKRREKSKANKKKGNKRQKWWPQSQKPVQPKRPTALDRLRMETDLRAKLISGAQCINGLIDHTCPFNYQQMLNLISSSLERERTVSFTSQKVLPMVGYLIKSRNYTGTLSATFLAIERINNYTIEADSEGKPIDFSHILDEILNRNTGESGLRIVDTSNESASASVWEDDEFDHVLQNPYERRRPASDNYKLDEKKRLTIKKATAIASEQADESATSEEDTSEEGLIFDRPRPPSPQLNSNAPPDGESSSEEEQNLEELHAQKVFDQEKKKKEKRKKLSSLAITDSKKKLSPPPVFGHLQKSAEDE